MRLDLLWSKSGGTTGPAEGAADAKSVAEARPRGNSESRRTLQSMDAGQRALVEGTRGVWLWGDATETASTVESGRCR